MERGGCIYIMTNYNKTVLYIGVTSDLYNRILEHKQGKYPNSFTAKYQLKYCVYYEFLPRIEEAIVREKEIKKWRREKKELLINSSNPKWDDLWELMKEW